METTVLLKAFDSTGISLRALVLFSPLLPFPPFLTLDVTAQLFLFNDSFFSCCSSTIVSISPHHTLPPHPSPPPTLHPTRLWLCPCALYTCSLMTLLFFFPLSPPPPPLVTVFSLFKLSLKVCSFNVCGYILLACLFCWLGSIYRWDHVVFVFHFLAYFT